MTLFIRTFFVAAVLAAGSSWAQQQAPGSPVDPNSVRAKDKKSSDTPSSITDQEVDRAAQGDPNAVDSKDSKLSGTGSHGIEAAERGNPHSTQNKDRDKLGSGPVSAPDQMGDMDHDEMMSHATPQMMLQRLHLSNLHETEMGQLAEQNGSNRIRRYAQTLVHDHQDADLQVKALAKKKNIALSDTLKNPEMKRHMQLAKDRFAGLKGADFDRAYLTRMSIEHKRVISMAQNWRQNCVDQDVCGLIDQLLPTLQQHAHMADQLKIPAAQGRPAPNNR